MFVNIIQKTTGRNKFFATSTGSISGTSLSLNVINLKRHELNVIPDWSDRVYTKKKPTPARQFSHLFNAYTKAFNIRYKRHGGLFERPFERIRITHENYFRNMVWYIHNNPVHHGFVEHMIEYPWSSYQTMISVKPTKLSRDKVVGWFNSRNEFQVFHQEDQNIKDIRKFIIE